MYKVDNGLASQRLREVSQDVNVIYDYNAGDFTTKFCIEKPKFEFQRKGFGCSHREMKCVNFTCMLG